MDNSEWIFIKNNGYIVPMIQFIGFLLGKPGHWISTGTCWILWSLKTAIALSKDIKHWETGNGHLFKTPDLMCYLLEPGLWFGHIDQQCFVTYGSATIRKITNCATVLYISNYIYIYPIVYIYSILLLFIGIYGL